MPRKAQPRERISPNGNTRFVRRDSEGKFKQVVDAGQSLRIDRSKKSKTKVPVGQGDKGETA